MAQAVAWHRQVAAMVEAAEPITASWVDSGEWTVDVAGVRHPARVSLRPLYDPAGARVRG